MGGKNHKGNVVSLSQLAGFFGVHRNTVAAWVKKGCPFISQADRNQGREWQFSTAEVAQWRADQAVRDCIGDTTDVSKEDLIKRKLAAETTIAEIEASIRRGEVAPLSEIERQWANTIIEVRARFRQLPARVAPQVFGIKKLSEVKEILLQEVDETLTVLSYEFDEDEE